MHNSKLLSGLVWLIVVLVSAVVVQAQQAAVNTITAEELKTKMTKNEQVTVIDVRSSEGFANSSTTVKGSIHFKVRKLKSRLNYAPLKDLPRNREIVTYCACPKDESSIAAAQILQAAGFTRVRVLQGGWREWVRVNGPVQPRARS
ncbi:MAG TPA: rhodanese-like domain-containing protein [Pyrinomonadaceae bacterium]|nr:rhodanese-like domain-containing protein [Pyrinomonadaceae bacterium]